MKQVHLLYLILIQQTHHIILDTNKQTKLKREVTNKYCKTCFFLLTVVLHDCVIDKISSHIIFDIIKQTNETKKGRNKTFQKKRHKLPLNTYF